ncbi:PspC domain-containing protein [Streptomyces sp. B1866]|uniref:PspC domain-containing protein n=1 Tax=Streptomyces sp. B1866 TaxID=3075431 RepID=UPI00288D8FA8|nr:PspC domain-containing protein [Streptomyces sp. B1866]MDT3398574.1 PspC domain-containing protein [Streptomyces sp. B1866]
MTDAPPVTDEAGAAAGSRARPAGPEGAPGPAGPAAPGSSSGGAGGSAGPGGSGPAGGPGGPGGPAEARVGQGRAPLRRSREQKTIAGVCGGFGRYCDVDPVIFRVVLSVLAVTGGLGLVVYGFCWLLVPLHGEEENEGRRLLSGRVEGPALTAVLCALVGCGLFLSMLNNGMVMTFSVMLSGAVVGAGYWSYRRRQAESEGAVDPATAQTVADAPPETRAPPPVGCGPSWWRDPIVKDGTTGPYGAATGYLWGPDDGAGDGAESAADDAARADGASARPTREPGHGPDYGHGHGPDYGHRYGHGHWHGRRRAYGHGTGPGPGGGPPAREAAGAVRRREAPERTPLGGLIFLLALAAAVVGAGVRWPAQPVGTSLEIGLTCALGVIGLGLLVSCVFGRTGAGTIVLAVVTSALLAGAAALPKSITPDWADRRTWAPTSAAAVRDAYELGGGIGDLRLEGVPVAPGQTLATRAEVGAGQLTVTVPADVTVRLRIEVGLGDIQLPGDRRDDFDMAPARKRTLTLPPADGHRAHGTWRLDLRVGIGQAEVVRR